MSELQAALLAPDTQLSDLNRTVQDGFNTLQVKVTGLSARLLHLVRELPAAYPSYQPDISSLTDSQEASSASLQELTSLLTDMKQLCQDPSLARKLDSLVTLVQPLETLLSTEMIYF